MPKPLQLKVSTKTGDKGHSGLADGRRMAKHAQVFHALGDVDELNSWLGLIAAQLEGKFVSQQQFLLSIQEQLFYVGAELAASKHAQLSDTALSTLEQHADELQTLMAENWTTKFLLPGGSILGGYCDVARAVCRRAERSVAAHAAEAKMRPLILKYMNRLSDYLYLLRSYVNQELAVSERKFIKSNQ